MPGHPRALMDTWSLIRVDGRSAYGSVINISIQLAVFDNEMKRNKYFWGRCVYNNDLNAVATLFGRQNV